MFLEVHSSTSHPHIAAHFTIAFRKTVCSTPCIGSCLKLPKWSEITKRMALNRLLFPEPLKPQCLNCWCVGVDPIWTEERSYNDVDSRMKILVKIYLNQPERSGLLAVNVLTSILGSNSNRSYTYMHTKTRAKSTKHRGKSHLILVSLETSQNDLHNRGRGPPNLTVFDQGS